MKLEYSRGDKSRKAKAYIDGKGALILRVANYSNKQCVVEDSGVTILEDSPFDPNNDINGEPQHIFYKGDQLTITF